MPATFDPGGGPSAWLSAEASRYFEQLDAPSEFMGEPAAEYYSAAVLSVSQGPCARTISRGLTSYSLPFLVIIFWAIALKKSGSLL
jgi:hypothetical protein